MQITRTDNTQIYTIRDIPLDGILEFLFHSYLIYSMLSVSYGIYIPNVSGTWLLGLAGVALVIVRWDQINKSFTLMVIAVAILHILIQAFFYKLPILSLYVRPFIFWLPMMIVVYTLAHRAGFIQRLAIIMFVIALLLLPYLFYVDAPSTLRGRLYATSGIDNSNDYAAWLSFCSLVFWLWSWKVTSRGKQLLLITFAILAVLVMTQTVSRTGLYALAAGILLSIRNIPRKRWPLIVLGAIFVVLMSVTLPFIQQSVLNYQLRLHEDTGRQLLLSSGWEAVRASPVIGYGVDRIGGARNIMSSYGNVISLTSPHNAILLLWLSSGILPVIPFIVMWILAFRRSFKYPPPIDSLHLDYLPLVLYSFLVMMVTNSNFMQPWAIAAVGGCFVIPKNYIQSPWQSPFRSRSDFRSNVE